jgi:hypothetical protein
MPSPSEVVYSRDKTIAAVRDYYQFICKLYLPEWFMLEPPPGGWPSITKESTASFGKTDEVIELLRHLPYVRKRESGRGTHAAPWAVLVDYQHEFGSRDNDRVKDLRLITELWEPDRVPAHVVGLAGGHRDNNIFLLDTESGIIHWTPCPDGPAYNPSREQIDFGDHEQEVWRCGTPAWAVADFFELLKDEFRALNFVPIGELEVSDVYTQYTGDSEGVISMLQSIYREHNWPDLSAYKKDECLQAVKRALSEHYPMFLSSFGSLLGSP